MNNEKVVDINKNRIVLTNLEILNLVETSPFKAAFDRIQNTIHIDGKKYYWVYRTSQAIITAYQKAVRDKDALIKKFCDKDEKGEPIFLDSQYQFDPDQKKLYEEEIKSISDGGTIEIAKSKEITLKYCKKDKNDKPIKVGGTQVSFSGDNAIEFNVAFTEFVTTKTILPFNKIEIDSTLLAQMNSKSEKLITIADMMILGNIFDFIE